MISRSLSASVFSRPRTFRQAKIVWAVLVTALAARGQTNDTWLNATGTFATGSNWSLGTAPANSLSTNIAVFSSGTAVNPILSTSQSLAGIAFTSTASSYSFGGSGTLTLGYSGIVNSSASASENFGSLALGSSQTWSSAGGVLGFSNVSLGSNTLTLAGTGTSAIGHINGTLTGSGSIIFNTSGTYALGSGINTSGYTGNLVVDAGSAAFNGAVTLSGNVTLNESAAGTGLSVNSNSSIGNLIIGGSNSTGSSANNVFIATGDTLTLNGGSVTFDATNGPKSSSFSSNGTGTLSLGANTTFNVAYSSGATSQELQLNVIVAGSGSLTKTGNGALRLGGANTYSGGTVASNGTLFLGNSSGSATGSGTVLVETGAWLEGTGSAAGQVTIASGSALTPGTGGGIGTLTFNGGLVLDSGSTSNFDLGTANDKVVVTAGGLVLQSGLTLDVCAQAGFHAGTYTLFSYNGAGASDAADFTLGNSISGYTLSLFDSGNNIDLLVTASAVPEPATYAAVAGAFALILVIWRRRRTSVA